MSTRLLDPVAVQAQLRRLARLGTLRQDPVPWLHGEVARRMAERLAIIRLQPRSIVEWSGALGGGSGLLRAAYPGASRCVVEPNALLAEATRLAEKLPWWAGRRWTGSTVPVLTSDGELPGEVELIWANMVLHAVADPPALIDVWHRMLTVDGFVMFSCLGPDSLSALRALYRDAGWPAPGIDFVDMHDLGDMLVQAGFADPVMDQETLTLTWDSAEALLAELRSLGGNVLPERFAGLRTPRWRARLLEVLNGLRGADGRLSLRFEIAYGHAFKSPPRLPRPAQKSTVTLDAMRALVRRSRATG